MSETTRMFNCTPQAVFDVLTDGWTYATWVVGAARIRAVDENFRATIFEWPSGHELRTFTAPAHGHGRSAAAMTSRDGRYFAWRGEDIHVWDVTSGGEAIEPVSGAVILTIMRIVVVLPAPLVPISVTTSPASTVNEMPLTASIFPYATRRSRTSSITVTTLHS